MTYPTFCRLCLNMGLDFKSLYDQENQFTEVYELVTKYFDQSILNMEDAKHLTKVCLQCWEHIWDFNNFQKAIQVAQSNLDAVKYIEIGTAAENSDGNVTENECRTEQAPVNDSNKGDYICLSESDDEREVSNDIPSTVPEISTEIVENVDLTFEDDDDEFIASTTTFIEKHHESVNVFLGGGYSIPSENANNAVFEIIDLENECNPSHIENVNLQTAEIVPAHETDDLSYRPIIQHNEVTPGLNRDFMPITPLHYFNCALCPKIFHQYTKLLEHFNSIHPSRIAQVICCDLRLTGLSTISDHLIKNHEMKRLSCRVCGKTYVKNYYLERHMESYHPEANLG